MNFGSKKIKIYSPYVILNQTEIPLEFKSSNVPDQKSSGQYSETVKEMNVFNCHSLILSLFL